VLTIIQVAYPFAPVSLDATGGAEQVVAMLDRGLAERGHVAIAIAAEESRTRGELLTVAAPDRLDEEARRMGRQQVRARIREALERTHVDLVHMHGVDFHEYLPPEGVPVLATLHLPRSYYPDSIFRLSRPHTYLNCVSEAQRATFPGCENLMGTIENGIPLDLFPEEDLPRENYALAVGRICPEKGFHLAVDAAEKAGVPLWVAGRVFPYADHERYFREELLPRLRAPHRFLGPVGFARKLKLLSRARCLLVPSLVPETGSLAAMEALACGTPAITFHLGAPAAYVEHGRTGYVVQDVNEMAAAIGKCGESGRVECRARARSRFSADRMVSQYIELYTRVLIQANTRVVGA
jgi:glycosyltransferase involved in cell wall biosynthesis